MRFAGIIAEYDPFHNGHAWQLAQARALGAQRVAVAMSCGLTQRGALPLLPESVRVRAALECGADLVFALPAPWACAGAEAFARAGAAPNGSPAERVPFGEDEQRNRADVRREADGAEWSL